MKWAEKFKWYDAFVIFFLLDHLPLALMCNFRVVSTSCSILHRVSLFIMIIVMCVRAHLFIHFICEQMRTRASIYLSSSKLPANRPSLTFITLSNFFQCNPFHPMPVFFISTSFLWKWSVDLPHFSDIICTCMCVKFHQIIRSQGPGLLKVFRENHRVC